MPLSQTERTRRYRDKCRQQGKPYRDKEKHNAARRGSGHKPFVGCDGEGGGIDSVNRQLFKLFRMGDRELFNNGLHIDTVTILDFICDHPSDCILVGFSFGYDVTMILRDLPSERRERLLAQKERGAGKSAYTYFEGYGIDYMPKQYFRVCRIEEYMQDGVRKQKAVPGTARTIYETFGFFQKSFLKTLHTFNLGSKYLDIVERNKTARQSFDVMTDEVREYNRIECELLAELMEVLRNNCNDASIIPRTWNGAGKLADALHRDNNTIGRGLVETRFDGHLLNMATEAYYGGRFEITRTGKIPGPVYEYDIRSAYPNAMRRLPCLEHGVFKRLAGFGVNNLRKKPADERGLYIASVRFKCDALDIEPGRLGGLPVRNKEGRIYWPMEGAGVYWSCEIESAEKLGFKIQCKTVYRYETTCQCKPFQWVNSLYEYRQSIGSAGPGYPIKLGLNSLYGKLVQRIGRAQYQNMIWGGLITATTRTMLNECIVQNQGRIVMLATDGVYSLDKLELPIGGMLGQWEENLLQDGMYVVQPGLYWGAKKLKTRGVSPKFFEQQGMVEKFHEAFDAWREYDQSAVVTERTGPPSVMVPVTSFIGMKLAQSWGKPDMAGVWQTKDREISFEWTNKRSKHIWQDGCAITYPIWGGPKCVSMAHRDFIKSGKVGELDSIRQELDDQPDYVDLSAPWKD
jgi:hypothetical protein